MGDRKRQKAVIKSGHGHVIFIAFRKGGGGDNEPT
jgi:hypothetical protein